jgi:uncharacterized protein
MGRIFFFLLLAVVVYLAWRSFQRRNAGDAKSASGPGVPQVMVSCAKCGLHVPRHEALPHNDRFYCCEEHRLHPPGA